MSSTKTVIFTARVSHETMDRIRESGLSPREWVEKMAENADFNGVYTALGGNGTEMPENGVVDSVYTEFEELHFNELLEAMRRKGWGDSKIRNTVGQIRDQVLYS